MPLKIGQKVLVQGEDTQQFAGWVGRVTEVNNWTSSSLMYTIRIKGTEYFFRTNELVPIPLGATREQIKALVSLCL